MISHFALSGQDYKILCFENNKHHFEKKGEAEGEYYWKCADRDFPGRTIKRGLVLLGSEEHMEN
jgi:hypothetical protein